MITKNKQLANIVKNLLVAPLDSNVNINNGNRTFVFQIDKQKYFIKLCNLHDYFQEKHGYETIKNLLPVARLITTFHNSYSGGLVYKYENSVGKNKGLLIDYFSHSDGTDFDVDKILQCLNITFQKTINLNEGLDSQHLFKNRVKTRLPKYYNEQFYKKYTGKKITVNYNTVCTNLILIIQEVKKYFRQRRKLPCVISQGDITDLNVGLKPLFFDYLSAGYNPLMAELASQVWFNILFSNYLAPKYNPLPYQEHPNIRTKLDQVTLEKDNIFHQNSDQRQKFLDLYIKNVIIPTWKKCGQYNNWYDDFKNHFAIRVLSIFNLSEIEVVDQKITLFYLHRIYFLDKENRIDTPEQIIKYLWP